MLRRSGLLRRARNDTLFVLALVWLALLAACDRAPQLPRLAPSDVIVAFGDSLTYGTGASSETAYPAVLEKLSGRTVINAGVPGETTAEGLQRLPDVLSAHQPRLVLLCLGGNDMLRNQNHSAVEANLRQMIQTIRAAGAQVVLIGVPEPKLFSGIPPLYETLADEFNLPYEGEVFNDVLKNPKLKSDPIHANAAGYRMVAEHLMQLLQDSGAL